MSHFSGIVTSPPSTKLILLVEEQKARGLPLLHRQCRKRSVVAVKLQHASEIDAADHIDVVHQERFISAVLKKEPGSLLQSAARIEQQIVLTGNFDTHSKVAIRL